MLTGLSDIAPPRSWCREFEHQNRSLVSKHFFLDQLAQNVPRQNMRFLDSGSLIAGDADAVIDQVAQRFLRSCRRVR